jgi:hypothetical protein
MPENIPRRLPGFVLSVLLHCLVMAALLGLPSGKAPRTAERARIYHYSVQLIRLTIPKYVPQTQPVQRPMLVRIPRRATAEARASADASSSDGAGQQSAAAEPQRARAFSMPAFAMAQPVRQTLVRPDVAPGITLKRDVPLPTLLLAFDQKPPAYPVKRFVTPALRQVQKTAALTVVAAAPDLAGTAASASNLKVTAAMAELPRLPVPPPAMAQAPSSAVSSNAASGSAQAVPPSINVLSLSENPVLPNELLVIPPANQIAGGVTADLDGTRPGTKGLGNGRGDSARDARGDGHGNGAGAAAGKGLSGSGGGPGTANGAGDGLVAAGLGKSNSEAAGNAAVPGGDSGLRAGLPGTTELNLPKDGKFGVVVLGSTAAAPYPESSGVMSGKVVYTVYLRVGQRKNWILQYSLPRSAVAVSRVEGTKIPLEAPWPYLIVRPYIIGEADYVLVRGNISEKGHFDQLALVFPQEMEKKDLLLRSLGQWEFRAASRDGMPTAVDVLLIIPREE